MNYGTLMVHLELGKSNAALLNVAGDLAERCSANILAVTAYQPLVASPATVGVVFRETVECDDAEVERETQAAKAECRDLLAKRVKHLEWSCASVFTSLAKYIAGEARSADLILTTPVAIGALLPNTRQAHTGDLVMNAGRPVLLVPPTTA